MAYNSGNDPDALPAHLEPDQVAELLYRQEQQQQRQQQPKLPNQQHQQAQYQQAPNQQPPNQQPQHQQSQYQHPQYQQPQHRQPSVPPPRQAPLGGNPNPLSYQGRPQPPISQLPQERPPQSYNSRPPPNVSYNSNPHQSMMSPPPQNYGFGGPPQAPHGRSPPLSRPPPTPAPGRKSASDASLFPLFKAVDKNGTGQLSEKELKAALVNGDWTTFDPHTVKMMIRMFDVDKSGTIGFDEFCGLWAFLAAWRALFDRFDEDKSGYISFDEYSNALVTFGYRLSSTFVNLLFRTYDKSGGNSMSFDLFVQSCIILKRMTDVFKKYDEDRDGYITLSFEEFLTEILRQR